MDDPALTGKLKKAKVGIAGAGGLGSNIAVSLARAGVGELVVVDFDRVEASNLNRQYYFWEQIGELKVNALKENIDRIGFGTKIDALDQKLEKGSMHDPFADVDVVVEALDSARVKADLIEDVLTHLKGKPLVAASGVAGYGRSDRIKLERFGDLYLVQDNEARSSNEDVLMAPRVSLFANYQANVVLELLLEGWL
ncbi:MAG: sulfur carrier protein ThiS adenylyltransferase ThiF [Candidatus Thermoplasmatota archaeon]|nr:sulfur carrier protein ThiS adenylyltransferase ThiF [Candidatus Thermoplasmatota archaeon]